MTRWLKSAVILLLLTAILLLPMQGVLAQDTQTRTVMIDGEPVQVTLGDLAKLVEIVNTLQAISATLQALDFETDFFSEQCFFGVCLNVPDLDKPGWQTVEDTLADMIVVLETTQELSFIDGTIVDDQIERVLSLARTVQSILSTLLDALDIVFIQQPAADTTQIAMGDVNRLIDDARNFLDSLTSLNLELSSLLMTLQGMAVEVDNLSFQMSASGQPVVTFSGSTKYQWAQVYIATQNFSQNIYLGWDAINCGDGCVLAPATGLPNGSYTLFFHLWSAEGMAPVWIGPVNFTLDHQAVSVNAITAQQPTINGSSTVLRWQAPEGVNFYQLWVGMADAFTPVYTQWLRAYDLNCHAGGMCEVVLPNIAPGDYVWYLRGWGAGGFTVDGIQGWLTGPTFTVP